MLYIKMERVIYMTLLEQQEIAANVLKQPLSVIQDLSFVDEKTGILCLISQFKDADTLMTKEEMQGYKGGFVFLVGTDGGVLTSGSMYSLGQLIELYKQGERSNIEEI